MVVKDSVLPTITRVAAIMKLFLVFFFVKTGKLSVIDRKVRVLPLDISMLAFSVKALFLASDICHVVFSYVTTLEVGI